MMNGAESLVRTLVGAGVEVCFANPGTSEMHFVAALDKVGGIRCILGLFEGVVTGAADGYARMAEKPGVSLLHTGPGLANGLANLHNAKKSSTPLVNIVGEHASWHIEHDAPLTSDIEGLARPVSHWIRTVSSSASLANDGAAAMAAALKHPGKIATLILPANTAWEDANAPASTPPTPPSTPAASQVSAQVIKNIAEILRLQEPTVIIMGGHCLRANALAQASKIAQATNTTLLSETFKTRMQRGAGRVAIGTIPYAVDQAIEMLAPFKHVITVCAKPPIAFFAYPDKPSELYSPSAQVHTLANMDEDGVHALEALVRALDASDLPPVLESRADVRPNTPDSVSTASDQTLTVDSIDEAVVNLMPDNAIVINEAVTSGRNIYEATRAAAPHDWLEVCGGSIGDGLPLATGAAIACPDRKVLTLQADGSAMYTVQALWTQARESLDITTIIYANRCYAILKHELNNVQADSGDIAQHMMELNRPELDWVSIAKGMGVDAVKATTVAEFNKALKTGLAMSGPYLIEAVI